MLALRLWSSGANLRKSSFEESLYELAINIQPCSEFKFRQRIIFANLFLNAKLHDLKYRMTSLQHLHGQRHTVLTRILCRILQVAS